MFNAFGGGGGARMENEVLEYHCPKELAEMTKT